MNLKGLFARSGYCATSRKKEDERLDELLEAGVVCYEELQVSRPPAVPLRPLEHQHRYGGRVGGPGGAEHQALALAAGHWLDKQGQEWRSQPGYPGDGCFVADVGTAETYVECGLTQKHKVSLLLLSRPEASLVIFPYSRPGVGVRFFVPPERRQDAVNRGRSIALYRETRSAFRACSLCLWSMLSMAEELRISGTLRLRFEQVGMDKIPVMALVRCGPETARLEVAAAAAPVERVRCDESPQGLRVPGHDHEALIRKERRKALAALELAQREVEVWA